MSRHQYDLQMCLSLAGVTTGMLCDKCQNRCPICDSHNVNNNNWNTLTKVKICDSCAFGDLKNQCIICHNKNAKHIGYYCEECVLREMDRDGCPRILNVGTTKSDKHFINASTANNSTSKNKKTKN